MTDPVIYYVADFVSGVVLDRLPLPGQEVTKARGEVESASWDLAIPDPRVSSPTYVEGQGEELTPEYVNLIANPSFEVDTADWQSSANGNGVRDTTQARVGGASYKLTQTAAGVLEVFRAAAAGAAVTPGQTYLVTADVRPSRAQSCRLRVRWADAVGTQLSIGAGPNVSCPANEWTRLTHVFTAPLNAASGAVRVGVPNGQAGDETWVDAVMLVVGDTVIDYFDGDTPGCVWTGTPHASTSRLPATFGPGERTYRRDDAWATLLEPIKTCILAEWRGRLIQAWFVVADTLGNPTVPLQGATLARQFEKTYIRDVEFFDTDLSAIAAGLMTQVLVPRDGWEVQWSPCGVRDDHFWTFDQLVSLYSGFETLQAAEGGPVWDTSVDWVPGEEGRRFTKTALFGPRPLGAVRPEAIFTAKPGEYTRTRDFTGDNAAFELWGVTEGSGGNGITEDSWRSPKLDQGWPTWEGVVEFTDMDDEQLARRRDGRGPELADGVVVWEATMRIDEQPLLGDEWIIGDTVTLRAKAGDHDPTGGEITAEVEGWTLNTEQGSIVVGMVQESAEDE